MRPLIIAVLAAATASSACVEDNPGLVVAGNLRVDDMCLAVPTGALLGYGTYDVAFPHPYLVAPLFRSGLVSRTAVPGPPTTEPNDIQVMGADVTITADGAAIAGVAAYTVPMTAFVPAAVDGETSLATGLVEAIPSAIGVALAALAPAGRPTIVVTMTFYGRTTGGTDITAGPWSWPVELCLGCLEVPCATMIAETQCFAGQDGYVYTMAGCPVVP